MQTKWIPLLNYSVQLLREVSPLQRVALNCLRRKAEQEVRTAIQKLKAFLRFSGEKIHRMVTLYWRREEIAQVGVDAEQIPDPDKNKIQQEFDST